MWVGVRTSARSVSHNAQRTSQGGQTNDPRRLLVASPHARLCFPQLPGCSTNSQSTQYKLRWEGGGAMLLFGTTTARTDAPRTFGAGPGSRHLMHTTDAMTRTKKAKQRHSQATAVQNKIQHSWNEFSCTATLTNTPFGAGDDTFFVARSHGHEPGWLWHTVVCVPWPQAP